MRIFIDCDGVLANFDKLASEILEMEPREFEDKFGTDEFYKRLSNYGNFFSDLEVLDDGVKLLNTLISSGHVPIILTGAPMNMPESYWQKIDWIERKFTILQRFIITQSKNKALYCKPGDILIDDWPKHKQKWIDAGGIWIDYIDYNTTIEELSKLDISIHTVYGR